MQRVGYISSKGLNRPQVQRIINIIEEGEGKADILYKLTKYYPRDYVVFSARKRGLMIQVTDSEDGGTVKLMKYNEDSLPETFRIYEMNQETKTEWEKILKNREEKEKEN